MKFVCLGFIEESKYNALSEAEGQQMMAECFAYDDQLRRDGHFLGGEALQSANTAVTLRAKDGAVIVTNGPYAETKEMLGGILFLEARDLQHAIELMSRHPGVKVGPFEIRPADMETNQRIAELDRAIRPQPKDSFGIAHRVGIQATVDQVVAALTTAAGITAWWTREVAADLPRDPSFVATFRNSKGEVMGAMKLRVAVLEPNQHVQWTVEAGPDEWPGTKINFFLKREGEQTIVLFQHLGWREPGEFMSHCSMKWAIFLLSLKSYVESGTGSPAPDDQKIDNWN